MAAFTFGTLAVLILQLREMYSGGVDTRDLAVAAGKQADAAKALAEQSKTQTQKMAESLNKTDALLREATFQASSTANLASAAKDSADTARRALGVMGGTLREMQVEQRPWISVEPLIAGPLSIDDRGVHVVINFVLTNTGHTPARNVVVVQPRFVPITDDEIKIDRVRKIISNIERPPECGGTSPDSPTTYGVMLFPGQSRTETKEVSFSRQDLDRYLQKTNDGVSQVARFIWPTMYSCVDYRFTQGDQHHHTPLVYDLMTSDAQGHALGLDITTHSVFPAKSIFLMPHGLGNGASDTN